MDGWPENSEIRDDRDVASKSGKTRSRKTGSGKTGSGKTGSRKTGSVKPSPVKYSEFSKKVEPMKTKKNPL